MRCISKRIRSAGQQGLQEGQTGCNISTPFVVVRLSSRTYVDCTQGVNYDWWVQYTMSLLAPKHRKQETKAQLLYVLKYFYCDRLSVHTSFVSIQVFVLSEDDMLYNLK